MPGFPDYIKAKLLLNGIIHARAKKQPEYNIKYNPDIEQILEVDSRASMVSKLQRRLIMCDDFVDDFGDPCEDSGYDGLEWQDWMIICFLSEQIAEEKRERGRIERDVFGDDT